MGEKAKLLVLFLLALISTSLLLVAFDYLKFVSPSLVVVGGTVTDDGGNPVAGAVVTVGNCTTYTDQNGNFILKIAEGVYNLTIKAKDYQTLNTLFNAAGHVKNGNFTLNREKLAELEPSDEKVDFNCTSCISNATKISVDSRFCECENMTAFLFLIRGCTGTSYLRVLVGELYENGVWSLLEKPQVLQYTGGNINSNVTGCVQKYQVNFEVQPLTFFGGFIPSAQNPYYISSDHSLVYYINQQIFFSECTFTSAYNVTYTHYGFDLETLKDTDVSCNTNYLAVPPELLEKLKPLALNITSNLNSPFEKLVAIEDYLRNNYEYDLNYTRAPAGVDPVEWFLFHSKKGVCTHFNSAFVLLARSIGFPARLVAGYLINPSVEYQIVKPKQRHAYAEVLFENLGWITFDATAPCNCYEKPGTPTLKIVHPSQGAYISSSKITVAGEAYGFYKNAELYINHTGFSLTFWDGDFAFDNSTCTQDGELTIEVSISDAVGNKASDSVKFTVDNTPPKVFISFPSNGTSIASPTIYMNGTVQELNMGNVQPSINDTRFTLAYWNASTGAFSFINQTDISGEVDVEVSFVDLAGNVGSDVLSFKVKSEVSPPTRIPTRTNITSCSSNMALKGSAFYVEGSVFDANGNPVSNLNVVIYVAKDKSGVGTPVGTGKVVNGYFNVTCCISKEINVGDYLLIAETVGDEGYEGSRSDPPLKVLAETVVELSSPDKVVMGRGFTVNGTLKEKFSGQPIVNETVCITINSESYLLKTDNQGGIIISNVTLWQPGNYTATLIFSGSTYYLGSSSSNVIRVLAIKVYPTTNETFVRGKPAAVSGRVYAEDLPLDHENLTIKLYGNVVHTAETDHLGRFNVSLWVPENETLGEKLLEYRLERYMVSETQKVRVVAETKIRCVHVETLNPGWPLNITAFLTDNLDKPVANATLNLLLNFNGANETRWETTEIGGSARFYNLSIPEGFNGNLTYKVTFYGNTLYLPSSHSGSINVPPASPNMLLLLFAGLPIPAIIISAVVWRRRKKAPRGEKAEPSGGGLSRASAEEKPRVSISFPQIRNPLPPVWGVGEPLVVRISVFDPSNAPVPSATVRVNVEGLGEVQLTTRDDGSCEATYTFNEKGTFKIKASLEGWVEASGEVEVRVVDYREEVVRLFNSFYASAKEKFNGLVDEMTPREMQSTIMSQVAPAKHKPLETLTWTFEVADYSLHPIGRREYEDAFLSIMEFWS